MTEHKPPFFDNKHRITLDQLSVVVKQLPALDERNRKLLTQLVLAGEMSGIAIIAQRLGVSPSAIRARLKTLVTAGLVEQDSVKYDGCRRQVSLFRMGVPETKAIETGQDLFSKPKEGYPALPNDAEIHGATLDTAQMLRGADSPFFIDNLFCTVLFTALPVKRTLCLSPVHVTIDWYGNTVPITLRPLVGNAVCKADDLRYFVGLISFLTELVQGAGIPQSVRDGGAWTIKVSEVLRLMGSDTSGGNVNSALDAYKRLASTHVEFDSLPADVMERYQFDRAEQNIQALSNYGVYQHKINTNKSTFITFTLPPTIQSSLLAYGKNFFMLSPNAVRYNDTYMLRLHLWAKRRLGRSLNQVVVDHGRAHREISPAISFADHVNRLNKTVAEYSAFVDASIAGMSDGIGKRRHWMPSEPSGKPGRLGVIRATINVFGFIVALSEEYIKVTRDISDPIAGDGRQSVLINKNDAGDS